MKNEQETLNLFQVEELEKRFEMGWIDKAEVNIDTGNEHNCPTSGSSGGGGGSSSILDGESQHLE